MSALLAAFYKSRVSRKFWAFGLAYTIVRYRHIGIDIATTGDVPALRAGRVVRVRKTSTMGYVVVVQVGLLFFAYCHLSSQKLPKVGDKVKAGEVIGRLAWSGNPRSEGYGGTLWNGQHLHLVVTTHADGAYQRVGASYFDPAPLIRDTLTIPTQRTAQVATSSTKVYAAPDTDAPALRILRKDEKVSTVGAKVGKFERIIVDGAIGYVLASRLIWRFRTVNTPGSRLNYRNVPQDVKGSKVLGALKHGTKVEILGTDSNTESSKWAWIRVGGEKVWVSRKFLK
ncbi:SH3 domain-containing protein [Microbacterium sp.]|uniref:SH3 domain-containing protein n=1 Tax=Microbacterium sp. TaxID=51671 RepID=UPI0039E51323